ncbi:MAG TPA: serine/threonine protein kinase [Planctomycetota bacterium]|jgi:RIO-like serine/threonine protein kinase|nr:serine/threonine protein kinase [Planctomycetota bacterium]HJM39303.1 serine/threonine protein kinase [Planctomycetota bacterium]|tara:strand:- start:50446 stop:51243 length:798 start_codon:yes stop_codon:yes gene_type:complete
MTIARKATDIILLKAYRAGSILWVAKEARSKSSKRVDSFQPESLLKSDQLGRIERGHSSDGDAGKLALSRRQVAGAWWWLRPLARLLLRREGRALRQLDSLPGIPGFVQETRGSLTRTWVAGEPMQIAQPNNPAYFEEARRLLTRMHRMGVAHNDTAKEPNWLVRENGMPGLVDFQLAVLSKHRGKVFRILAREDLRHLLKHKRTYCPRFLTEREMQILKTPSLLSRIWMSTGKKVYWLITRKIFGWKDREGAGDRGGNPPTQNS